MSNEFPFKRFFKIQILLPGRPLQKVSTIIECIEHSLLYQTWLSAAAAFLLSRNSILP